MMTKRNINDNPSSKIILILIFAACSALGTTTGFHTLTIANNTSHVFEQVVITIMIMMMRMLTTKMVMMVTMVMMMNR